MLAQIFKGYTWGKIIFRTLQHCTLGVVQNCYIQKILITWVQPPCIGSIKTVGVCVGFLFVYLQNSIY